MIQAINPPIHPPNQTPTHRWGSLHRFLIFKHNQIISIHSSLIEFLLIMRGPPMGVDVLLGVRVGGDNPHTHAYTHACICTHVCTHTHTHVKHDKHGCCHAGGHLQFPNMLILAFHVCTCEHVCMYISGGTPIPQMRPHPSAPHPQSCREPKSLTVNKS